MSLKFISTTVSRAGLVALVFCLTACAGMQEYREGNSLLNEGKLEPGLAKLEEAVRQAPKNVEYRITLANRKQNIVHSLNAQAEAVRQQGNADEAEKYYRRVLAIDAANVFARQGLDALTQDRRHKKNIEDAEALMKKGGDVSLTEALDKLRPVLAENPRQQAALTLKTRISELQSKQKPVEAQLSAAYRKLITLEFRDAPLRSVFDVVSRISGLNFFFDKDVRPDLRVTIFSKQTSIEDAVRLLLTTNQLEQTILNENSIVIYPNVPQKLREYQQLSIRTFYLANADVKAVSNTIKTILKTKDLVIDERLGLIIMRDTPDAIRIAERIIAMQDLSDPEVMLEVEVLEVKRTRLMELGLQWPSQVGLSLVSTATSAGTTAGTTSSTSALTLADLSNIRRNNVNVAIGNFTVNLNKNDADSNILANPRIRVRNKEKAKIQIGDRVPVFATTSTSTGFISDSVSYQDVGLTLNVEPNIFLDEEVAIKVGLEVSNVVREVVSKSGTSAFQIGTRNATTVLRLKDGETQVLAGLISDEERTSANKVPGLGELPIVGRLFGSQNDDKQRSEIVLSITPHIIRSIRRPDLAVTEFNTGTEASISGRALMATHDMENADKSSYGRGAISAVPAGKPAFATMPGATDQLGRNNNPFSQATDAQAQTPGTQQSNGAQQPTSPQSSSSATPVSTAAAIAPVSGLASLSWQGPAQVNTGEQFSVQLKIDNSSAVKFLSSNLAYDSATLQITNIQEGDFFKQGNAQTSFSHKIDNVKGTAAINVSRQSASGTDVGASGTGGVTTISFRAIKSAAKARVQLEDVSLNPQPAAQISLPDYTVQIQ